MKLTQYFLLFTFGATLYAFVEVFWRGYTHWSMMIAGGAALCFIYCINDRANYSTAVKCVICSLFITMLELLIGLVVNLWLGLKVWDYSKQRFNILGQICPLYSFFWFLLSAPALRFCSIIRLHFFNNRTRHLDFDNEETHKEKTF